MTLAELGLDDIAVIDSISGVSSFKKRLFELGFMRGTELRIAKIAPFKGPILVNLKGYKISIRIEDANNILVKKHESKH